MRILIGVLIAGLLGPGPGQAWAAAEGEYNALDIRLGAFRSNHDTKIRVDGENIGTEIDFEDVLGLEETLTKGLRGAIEWRFAQRHRFTAEAYSFRRSSSLATDTSFTFDDVVVLAGAGVDTALNIDVIDTKYGYYFVDTPNHELVGNIGFFWMDLSAELAFTGGGLVIVDGEPIQQGTTEQAEAKGLAPLPVLGLEYNWLFAENWELGAGFEWFGIKFENYTGRLINVQLDVTYQTPWHFYVGGGASTFNLDIGADSSDLSGQIEWSFWGPQLFIGATFF